MLSQHENEEEFLNDPDVPESRKRKRIKYQNSGKKRKPVKGVKPKMDPKGCKIIKTKEELEHCPSYLKIKQTLEKYKMGFEGIFPVWNAAANDLGMYSKIDYRCRCGNKQTASAAKFLRKKKKNLKKDTFKVYKDFYVEDVLVEPSLLCTICRDQSIFRAADGRKFKFSRYKSDFLPLCMYKNCPSYGEFGKAKVEDFEESTKDENIEIYYRHCTIHREEEDKYENLVFRTNKCHECGLGTKMVKADGVTFACKKHIGDEKYKYVKKSTKCTYYGCEEGASRSIELPWGDKRCTKHCGRFFFTTKEKHVYKNFYSLCTKEDLKHLFCEDDDIIEIDGEKLQSLIDKRASRNYFCEEASIYTEDEVYKRAIKRLESEKAVVKGVIPLIDENEFRPDNSFISFSCACSNFVFRTVEEIASFEKVTDKKGNKRYLSCLCINCQNGFKSKAGVFKIDNEGKGVWKKEK